jgi:hypothetical protein
MNDEDATGESCPDMWNHARAQLLIKSDELVADIISERLNLMPSSSASRGEASPRHPENFFRTTTWCLMTPMNSHNTVESCLEALAEIIDGRQDKFLNLQDAGVHMHVSVMQSVWTDEIFFEISPKVLQFFAIDCLFVFTQFIKTLYRAIRGYAGQERSRMDRPRASTLRCCPFLAGA